MEYIVHRRFKGKCIGGMVNLPYGTQCELIGNTITAHGKPIVFATSENAYQYFARNDDGQGLKRGGLTSKIITTFREWHESHDPADRIKYDKAWARIWGDTSLLKFKRSEFADHWLWNFNFFNAEICDLEYITKILKEQENV